MVASSSVLLISSGDSESVGGQVDYLGVSHLMVLQPCRLLIGQVDVKWDRGVWYHCTMLCRVIETVSFIWWWHTILHQ